MHETIVRSILEHHAEFRPHATALETEHGTVMSYRELLDRVDDVSAFLYGQIADEVQSRPRIGVVMKNGADIAVTLLSATSVGAAIPFSPHFKAYEYEAYFKQTKIDLLVVHEDEDGAAVSVAYNLGLKLIRISPSRSTLSVTGRKVPPKPQPGDIALVLMTSGSTGRSKIVPLSHRNLCAAAHDVAISMDLGPDDRCLTMWEQYHIGGLVDLLMAPLLAGGTVIMTRGFSAAECFALMAEKRPTWFQGVPTSLNELVMFNERKGAGHVEHSLRFIRAVASPLSSRTMIDVENLFRVPVIHTYGMTEAAPLVTSTRLPPRQRKLGSAGGPISTEIRVIDSNRQYLPIGEIGEIVIRGQNVFSGYEDAPDINDEQFFDGWFRTGDIGYIDAEGDLFVTGRIKSLISRGGEKFSPNEIEGVLLLHPEISEAAVYAIDHPTLDEEVAAAVVLRGPVTVESIKNFVGDKLAAFKIPKVIMVLDRLPLNPIGKIDKLALAEASRSAHMSDGSFVSPRDLLEEKLMEIWKRELSVSEFGVYEDFAMLGGDSLSSIRILVAIERIFGVVIDGDVIEMITNIAALADYLTEQGIPRNLCPHEYRAT